MTCNTSIVDDTYGVAVAGMDAWFGP
jgi:hypothetical protein